MPEDGTVLYTFTWKLGGWFQAARAAGIDIDRFLSSKGITEKQMLEPDRRMLRQQAIEWIAELIELLGDPEIGLRLAGNHSLTEADLLGYLLRNCPHSLAAMHELSVYSRLISDMVQFKVEIEHGTVALVIETLGNRKIDLFEEDTSVGVLFRTISELTAGEAEPFDVQLVRPRPFRPDHYRAFFHAPVTFDANCRAIYYKKSALLKPIKGSDPRLRELLQQRADAILEDLPAPSSLIEQVRQYVARRIECGQEYCIETAARKHSMSERTFSRRLGEAGCSYRELIEEVRREEALSLAHKSKENVTTIAHRVGFADTTTFGRAFRRWTGLSPIEYLKKVRGNGAELKALINTDYSAIKVPTNTNNRLRG